MARTKISSQITFTGPFFTHDPSATFAANVVHMMEGIAQEGERDVRQQLATGEGSRAPLSVGGRLSGNVFGRVRGRAPWRRWVAISPYEPSHSAEEAIAIYAAAARVESETHAFRHTATALRKARAVNAAELLRGIE